MAALSAKVTGLFVGSIVMGLVLNVLIAPALQDTAPIAVGQVSRTNATGNQTAAMNETAGGIFSDPKAQLDSLLVILGITAGVAVAAAIAGFLTSGSSSEAARVGGIVGFLTAIALIVVGVLVDAQPVFNEIPVIGNAMFVIATAATFVIIVYAAAGFISGGGAY